LRRIASLVVWLYPVQKKPLQRSIGYSFYSSDNTQPAHLKPPAHAALKNDELNGTGAICFFFFFTYLRNKNCKKKKFFFFFFFTSRMRSLFQRRSIYSTCVLSRADKGKKAPVRRSFGQFKEPPSRELEHWRAEIWATNSTREAPPHTHTHTHTHTPPLYSSWILQIFQV